jgi:hypothetical protein
MVFLTLSKYLKQISYNLQRKKRSVFEHSYRDIATFRNIIVKVNEQNVRNGKSVSVTSDPVKPMFHLIQHKDNHIFPPQGMS